MTPTVGRDTWTPQRWPHTDVIAMQARLDPARMTEYADHWRRVLDDACAVFTRLDADVTRHLDESWRGPAGHQALEALRRYIFESLDGLARCRSLADSLEVLSAATGDLRASVDGLDHVKDLTEVRIRYSQPAVAAGNAVGEIPAPPALPAASAPAAQSPGSPVITVPAGYGAGMPSVGNEATWPGPAKQALRHNGFDEYAGFAPTYTAGSPPPPPSLTGTARAMETPLPAATSNAATMPTTPPAPPTQPGGAAPARAGLPYLPLMGGAYPGAIGRDDGGTRRTPGYLVTIDNGNELIGPLPKVAPPVLGDW